MLLARPVSRKQLEQVCRDSVTDRIQGKVVEIMTKPDHEP